MSKELFVSSTPRETKVAVVEEDQLAEVYFERENEYTLAGSIYKGRVTRVLPGMQSAFVNIGLERDAFLYVSDFLMEEEEDAEVLEHVPPHVPEDAEPAESSTETRPHQAAEVSPASLRSETESETAAEGVSGHDAQPADERDGARQWRGRRRRGRGRDRFQERGEPQDRVQAPAETHAPQAQTVPSHQHIVLPGESISKYQPHSAAQPSIATQAPQPPQPKMKASTEYSLDSAQVSPGSLVLPGESLSKYRNQPVATAAVGATVEAEPQPAAVTEEAAHAVQSERETLTAPATGAIVFAEPPQPEEAAGQSDQAVMEGPHADVDHELESAEHEAVSPSHPETANGESAPDKGHADGSWQAAGRGIVEEEEIEEDESELPEFDDEHFDLAEYEELEEEELAPHNDQMVAMGRELTEAVRDAHIHERATGQYEGEDLDPGDEDDEEDEADATNGIDHQHALAEAGVEEDGEELTDEIEMAAETEDLEGTRAEARAPGSTAGYQQPVERRPDRRSQRRLGRRMRGRPRHHVQRKFPAISDLLKEGQEILVQIAKEPIAKKGARITSHIALPGRYLVYMPTVHHTGVSRKIASDEERHRLKRIVLSERGEAHGGFIVRTAAAGANEDDLRADIRFLINLWNEIRDRADKSKAPALIYHDLNLVERILRDQVTTSFSSIWVDTEQEYERVLRFVSRFQPSLVKRVKLYTKEIPLFEQFNISEEINKALKSKVWLKSGGYIVINQTEALVAIDVNTGKYVGKTARLEDTIVKTNIDAIREIVRQIRLRDLGGIIVIDFIDMDERKNRQRVMQALEEALKADRAPSKVLQFNDFGLVAITRKRVKQSLERTLGQQCLTCTGTGMIKSVTTVCNEIYVEMRKMARHFEHDIMLRVYPDVAKALKASNARWLQDMEELTKQTILVKSDPLLHPEQFDIQ